MPVQRGEAWGKPGPVCQDGARAGTDTRSHLWSKDAFSEETAVRWSKEGSDFPNSLVTSITRKEV